MMNWKKGATFGVLAASLMFSQAAFADQATTTGTTTNTDSSTSTTGTTTNNTTSTTVTNGVNTTTTTSDSVYNPIGDKLNGKLDKIESKLEQFQDQKVPVQALQGKLGSIQNRIAAFTEQINQFQQQLNTLQGDQAKTAADSLKEIYTSAGDLQSAVKVEQQLLKKNFNKHSKDEDILKEYKELGKLLRQSGKVGVTALVNGVEPNMDVQPTIEDGRTLLPFRALAEALGAEVSFDPATSTVTVTKGDTKVVLTIDSLNATVNGQPYTLDVPAKVKDGRTLIPLRFLGQSLNAKVLWEPETQCAVVLGDTTEVPPATTTTTGVTTSSPTATTSSTEVTPATNVTTTGNTSIDAGTPTQVGTSTQVDPTTTTTTTSTQVN